MNECQVLNCVIGVWWGLKKKSVSLMSSWESECRIKIQTHQYVVSENYVKW